MPDRLILLQTAPGTGGDGGTGEGTGGDGSGTMPTTPPEGTGAGTGGQTDAEAQTAELEKVRKEAAKHRTELRAAQKRIEELESASKGDVERLTDTVTKSGETISDLTARNRTLRVRVLASKVGISTEASEDAAALLKPDAVADWDDDKSVEDALRILVKEKPYLAGAVRDGADGGAGGSREQPEDMNALIRSAAGREP